VAQAFFNKEACVRKIATETGAGQWGSSLAFAGSLFDAGEDRERSASTIAFELGSVNRSAAGDECGLRTQWVRCASGASS